ncbi:BTAD domain-containing putative transcriptional regulator [Nonomuraea sp. NEAU-A123]|uniref:BTAD domain-containing putative transcriptional regulator n=1 Tax=Nonomuraea sp. NEAU-A123 TaxID=2839649 RepID=UPI0027E027BA|nr:BTAD domain-containing putative transcriptional regulator [Nonomuraea sp. NEAU-A123]
MWIAMLGPLEVQDDDGSPVEVTGARLRTLLIVLALEPDRVVPMTRLIDGIWGPRPPAGAVNAVQALVSRLRRVLPQAHIEPYPAGYRLALNPDAVDVTRFERLAAAGRSALAHDPATAARTLREALNLWRGPALLDVADTDFFQAPLTHLSHLRLSATEDRIEADLHLGRAGELTTELTSLTAEHPLRERLAAALMRALCAAGRPAEALTTYERTRQALAETLGADPSPQLSALHTAVLRGQVSVTPPRKRDTGGAPPTNLRAPLTSFVGRDHEVTQIGELIGRHRLTTLIGPGGSGKTRLATETARTLLHQLTGGVWLADLAPISDDTDLPQTIMTALGIRGHASAGEPIDRLTAALRTRDALLVLDNCEHLIGPAATLADQLLGTCPHLRILATSREPLAITGEALWPVEPLTLPPEDADLTTAMSCAAVQLLSDRAGTARPGFAVTEHTTSDVVRICRALDGIPLAIELAAARLRTMTPQHLAGQLHDRFHLLTGGSRTAPPRHQTLRAVIDWSWNLLSEQERALLRRLTTFSGGATTEAAEHVCADSPATAQPSEPAHTTTIPADHVLDLLTALTDKSLLLPPDDTTPHYRMLETIKAYSQERLDEAGERDRIRHAHATYFAELAETADPHLRRAGQLHWLNRLAADHDNLNAATRAAIATGDAQTAVRLVAATGWYWWLHWALSGHKAEGAHLAAQALALPGPVDDTVRATACAIAAQFEFNGLGDEHRAKDWIATAQHLTENTKHPHPVVRLIGPLDRMLTNARASTDPPAETKELFADEDPWVRAMARLNRALTLINVGRLHTEAHNDLQAALTEFRAIGERWGITSSLTALAGLATWRGDLTTAIACYEQAIAVITEAVDGPDAWLMRLRLAQLRWLHGDTEGSAAAIAEVERDTERIALPDTLVAMAYLKADLARWNGDPAAAHTHLARAETLAQHITVNWSFRAMLLDSHGYLDVLQGDLDAARTHHADALAWALRSMNASTISQTLVGIANLALHQDQPQQAARLLAAGDAVRGTPDLSHPDAIRVKAATRAALSDREHAEAAQRGRDATIATVDKIAALTLDP